MTSSSYIELSQNDDLITIVKKCNSNFKSLGTQSQQQSLANNRQQDILIEEVSNMIGDVIDSVISTIEDEADLRREGDDQLQNAIEALDNNLARVAKTGNYNDLTNKPTIPIGGAYTTFGNENPSTIYGGTWSFVDSVAVGQESMKVWKRTA